MATSYENALRTSQLYTPQLPDIQELAKLVPQGAEAVPGLEALASDVTGAMQRQQIGQMETAAPGITGLFGDAFDVTGQMLAGIVPEDVQAQIQNDVAAAALGAGTYGSQFGGSQYARNLGLTSLDLINRGIGSLLQLTPAAQQAFTVQNFDIGAEIPGLEALYQSEVNREQAKAATASEQAQIAQANRALQTSVNLAMAPYQQEQRLREQSKKSSFLSNIAMQQFGGMGPAQANVRYAVLKQLGM